MFAAGLNAQISPPALAGPALPANGVGSQFELAFWQSVAGTEDRAQIETYLQQYPNGTFSALARAKIGAIDKREALARGTAPAAAMVPPSAPAPTAPAPAATVTATTAPALATQPALAAVAPSSAQQSPTPARAVATAADAVPAASGDGNAALSAMAVQLGALGRSQGQPANAAPTASTTAVAELLPARPVFAASTAFALPDHFCTAMDRNNFYDAVYKPAKDKVDENNRSAIAYLDRLKATYDRVGVRNDIPTMTLIAKESQDYQAIAGDAYKASVAYEGLFAKLMAVPVGKCP